MNGAVNKVIIIGNLGQDPEVKSFQNGGKVCNLRVATSESWNDKDTGERKERTEWHSVAIFGDGLAGVAERFLRKGSKVYVEGQLRTRKWQDRAGADRYSTEVVLQGPGAVLTMLGGKQSGDTFGFNGDPATNSSGSIAHGNQTGFGTGAPAMEDLDDEVPF